MLLDRLGPPGRCRGCWPHDGEVAGGAVADFGLVISGSRRRPRRSQVRGQLRHDRSQQLAEGRLAALPFVAGDHFSAADITGLVTVDFATRPAYRRDHSWEIVPS
jgi:glutathione S-transferase